ncbi:hypothetical protein, partial [Oenococcus oeni]|uniref:hypothetical protein n=1 Tax=Oenococcus oeni TaxID=1247 RepID=UPI001C90EB91
KQTKSSISTFVNIEPKCRRWAFGMFLYQCLQRVVVQLLCKLRHKKRAPSQLRPDAFNKRPVKVFVNKYRLKEIIGRYLKNTLKNILLLLK